MATDISAFERELKSAAEQNKLPKNVDLSLRVLKERCLSLQDRLENQVKKALAAGEFEELKQVSAVQQALRRCVGIVKKSRELLNKCIQHIEFTLLQNSTLIDLSKSKQKFGAFQSTRLLLQAQKTFEAEENPVKDEETKQLYYSLGELSAAVDELEKGLKALERLRNEALTLELSQLKELVSLIDSIAENFLRSTVPLVEAGLITDSNMKTALKDLAAEHLEGRKLLDKYVELLGRPDIQK